MSHPMDVFEREEEALHDLYAAGHLTSDELAKELRELQRSYRDEAEEAACEAYRNEQERW